MTGPLAGIRIVELAGIGPAPFCGMMLADHGAELLYCHRPSQPPDPRDPLLRGRTPVAVDLKTAEGVSRVRELAQGADGLIEGFRPGVMERLGLGPELLQADNPRLVYGRVTGWGQDGPLAQAAGHDINYIALSGVLHAVGPAGRKPVVPVNLVGDFGGGGMMLAFGMLAALIEARASGRGRIVDAAMTEGSALLASMMWGFRETLGWTDARGTNILDGGAHFYDVYETADGLYVALGAIEPQFYALFRETLGLADDPAFDAQLDRAAWPALNQKLDALFRTRTRAEWCALMEGTDICFAPVLSMAEAPAHPHAVARGAFIERAGVVQPAPAPRYLGGGGHPVTRS